MKPCFAFLFAALCLIGTLGGCGGAQPSHAGVYVDSIWTVPERVIAGDLVELHMNEVHDLPPGVTLNPSIEPAHWTVSAGELYQTELDGTWTVPLAVQPSGLEIESAYGLVMWRAPNSAQDVQVTAQQYGRPLTVTITVLEPTIDDILGGQPDLYGTIHVTDPEIHVNEVAMLRVIWQPRETAQLKEPALSPPAYDWQVSAGELFPMFPQYDQHGPLRMQGDPLWWRAPAEPQTVTVEYRHYFDPISTEIEVLPAP